jgi:hypothetical protein
VRWVWLWLVAGCQFVFPASAPEVSPDDAVIADVDGLVDAAANRQFPISQAVNAKLDEASTLLVDIAPTKLGSTLVVVVAISTESETLASIGDNGGNAWLRGVVGDRAEPGRRGRIEIWYAQNALSVTRIALSMGAQERAMAANLTEWDGVDSDRGPVAFSLGGPGVNAFPRTGQLEAGEPALVIAGTAFDNAAIDGILENAPQLTPMMAFGTATGMNEIKGLGAFGSAASFDENIRWELAMQQAWTAAAVAFPTKR